MKIKFVFIAIALMVCCVIAVRPQTASDDRRTVDQETYLAVLDSVFPRELPGDRRLIWQLVLRFMPNSQTESQIVIRRTFDGVECIRFSSSGLTVYSQISSYLNQTGKAEVVAIAGGVKVQRSNRRMDLLEADRLPEALLRSVRNSTQSIQNSVKQSQRAGSLSVLLHGAQYNIWFTYNGTELNVAIYDDDVDQFNATGSIPLVRWMNMLRISMDKAKWS